MTAESKTGAPHTDKAPNRVVEEKERDKERWKERADERRTEPVPGRHTHTTSAVTPTSMVACAGGVCQARVLIVEDNFVNQNVLTRQLQRIGFKLIDCAANGRIGVDRWLGAIAEGLPYSLVLMDWMMPVLDGNGAVTEIRDRERTRNQERLASGQKESDLPGCVPIIAVSALSLDEEQCRGVDFVLRKPTTKEDLALAIDFVLRRTRSCSV